MSKEGNDRSIGYRIKMDLSNEIDSICQVIWDMHDVKTKGINNDYIKFLGKTIVVYEVFYILHVTPKTKGNKLISTMRNVSIL